ncbi:MAG: hypothetical protein AAGH92_00020 [Planctomycetota bacterium]
MPPVRLLAAGGWTLLAGLMCLLGLYGLSQGQALWNFAWRLPADLWFGGLAGPPVIALGGVLIAVGWWASARTGSLTAWTCMRIFSGMLGVLMLLAAAIDGFVYDLWVGGLLMAGTLTALSLLSLWVSPSPEDMSLRAYLQRMGMPQAAIAALGCLVFLLASPDGGTSNARVITSDASTDQVVPRRNSAAASIRDKPETYTVTLSAGDERMSYERPVPRDQGGSGQATREDLVELTARLNADPARGWSQAIALEDQTERAVAHAPLASTSELRQQLQSDHAYIDALAEIFASTARPAGTPSWKLMGRHRVEGGAVIGWLRLLTTDGVPAYFQVEVRRRGAEPEIIDYRMLGHPTWSSETAARMVDMLPALLSSASGAELNTLRKAGLRLIELEEQYRQLGAISRDQKAEHLDELDAMPMSLQEHPACQMLWIQAAAGDLDRARRRFAAWEREHERSELTEVLLTLQTGRDAGDSALVIHKATQLEVELGGDGVLASMAAIHAGHLGREQVADELQQRAERLEPDEPQVFSGSLAMAVAREDPREAIRVLKHVKQRWPDLFPLWLGLVLNSSLDETEGFRAWLDAEFPEEAVRSGRGKG